MPTITKHEGSLTPASGSAATTPTPPSKPSIEVKQLQRYYTVLRDFMAHLHSRDDIYPPNHEFTQDELSSVTPYDIIRWMNMKLYNKENPAIDDRPLNGSHHTLDYYKKSISYFMPSKELAWNEATRTGNPTKCREVNDAIKRVREFDADASGGGGSLSRKRKATAPPVAPLPRAPPSRTAPVMAHQPHHHPTMPAAVPPVTREGAAMQGLLRTMHGQNAQFIDLFGALSRSLEQFKTTLQSNNNQINGILMELSGSNGRAPPVGMPSLIPPPPQAANAATIAEAQAKKRAEAYSVGTGMLDWQYVHADGVRRRVPPTWTFPHSNLQEMYIHWHCGDYQNRISPMKFFQNTDVSFLGKRARMNLNEVKNLMQTIDAEAMAKGLMPAPTMTLNQASACFQAGLSGFKFKSMTPTGKQRNIMRLKWSTLTKYSKQSDESASASGKLVADAEEKQNNDDARARRQFIEPSPDDPPHDKYWYQHDEHIKCRVPTTYRFPMLGLEDMYILWHCGQENISPMKLFHGSDVAHVKRGKTNLSEVRAIMTLIDLEAAKGGFEVAGAGAVTPEEAKERFLAGYSCLNIPNFTPDGKRRDIMKMKWSSATRLKNPGAADEGGDVEDPEDVTLAELKVPEVDADDGNDAPEDEEESEAEDVKLEDVKVEVDADASGAPDAESEAQDVKVSETDADGSDAPDAEPEAKDVVVTEADADGSDAMETEDVKEEGGVQEPSETTEQRGELSEPEEELPEADVDVDV